MQAVHRLSLQSPAISMHVKREPEDSNVLSYAVIYDEFPAWPLVRYLLGCGLSLEDDNAYAKLNWDKKQAYDRLLVAAASALS